MLFVRREIELRNSWNASPALLMLVVILPAVNGFAAELSIVAIGPGGQVETGCHIESFRMIDAGSKVRRDLQEPVSWFVWRWDSVRPV